MTNKPMTNQPTEARQREIPIVRLNPGGVLNWKYEAECAARASAYAYAVVRCTGLDDGSDEAAGAPRLLEADQGDAISGRVSRREAAAVIAAALDAPEAARKTFELRRSEAADAAGKAMGAKEMRRLFLKLAPGEHDKLWGCDCFVCLCAWGGGGEASVALFCAVVCPRDISL